LEYLTKKEKKRAVVKGYDLEFKDYNELRVMT
jgi:hypothetical protein